MTALVSIGMPVFNGERFLATALESILAQVFTDFELIVSDNASTDATADICREFAAGDSRIRYCRNSRNLGAAANFNRVFQLASGKYFKWAAHDDICLPEFLSRCAEVLQRDGSVVLCYPKVRIIDEDDNVIIDKDLRLHADMLPPHERFSRLIFVEHECYPVFGLIRTAVLKTTALIGRYISSDRALLAELSLRGRFVEVPEYLFLRRDHPNVSLRANRNYVQRARWFEPNHRRGVFLPAWRLGLGYVSAMGRAPLDLADKTRCYGEMCRWVFGNRRTLARQLFHAARDTVKGEPVMHH